VSDRGSFSGPLLPTGERAILDHRPANGVSRSSTGMYSFLLNIFSCRCCNALLLDYWWVVRFGFLAIDVELVDLGKKRSYVFGFKHMLSLFKLTVSIHM
jgi:hypothetical protein